MGNLGYGFCQTHPGELLKEEIEYRKVSQSSLAKQMGIIINKSLSHRSYNLFELIFISIFNPSVFKMRKTTISEDYAELEVL